MSQALCRRAIESRLGTWAAARSPALRVAWENVAFTPAGGETYLRAFLLPATTTSDTLAGDHRAFRGVYQVTVCAPINIGPASVEAIRDELDALFPMNLRITSGALTLQVVSPASAGPAIQEDAYFALPVSFRYRADT